MTSMHEDASALKLHQRRQWVAPVLSAHQATGAQTGAPPGANDGIGFFVAS